jgi:hypothetical protein
VNIEWNSEEVRGDYPRTWNQPHFSHQWTETEELILERSHQKMVERAQREKMMPRERVIRAYYGKDPDRLPFGCTYSMNYGARIFDSFAETPPVVHNRDLIEYPNLDVTAFALWHARFPADQMIHVSTTFGEEVLTRKFRLVEHGPPLAIEGACKTKEDMAWYLDNVPDPAQRGLYPVFLWTIKQLNKAFPEFVHSDSCCAGPLASASFLRGQREFLLDVRKNPEMAELALKCATAVFLKRIDRMAELLGPVFSPDNPNGNVLYWCDGGGAYLTLEEFKRTWDLHYGTTIPYCARKGIDPMMSPVASAAHDALIFKALEENLGGWSGFNDEVPPVEDGFAVFEKRDKTLDKVRTGFTLNSKNVLWGEEPTRKEIMRWVNLAAKTPEKGLRWSMGAPAFDVETPLPNIDIMIRLFYELGKYPVTV